MHWRGRGLEAGELSGLEPSSLVEVYAYDHESNWSPYFDRSNDCQFVIKRAAVQLIKFQVHIDSSK